MKGGLALEVIYDHFEMMIPLHASDGCPASIQVFGEWHPTPEKIEVRFWLRDPESLVKIPEPENWNANRQDELWHHTCFEVFARLPGSRGYWEFNFSPGKYWNLYSFDKYRDPQPPRACEDFELLGISWRKSFLNVELIPRTKDTVLWLNFCAVIELRDGREFFFSAHPAPGKPDFHWLDGMMLPVGKDQAGIALPRSSHSADA